VGKGKRVFKEGRRAGYAAADPMHAHDMALFRRKFVYGYVEGHREVLTVRTGDPEEAARIAGSLAFEYGLTVVKATPRMQIGSYLADLMRQGFEAAQASARTND
jgi:hypothetical protein